VTSACAHTHTHTCKKCRLYKCAGIVLQATHMCTRLHTHMYSLSRLVFLSPFVSRVFRSLFLALSLALLLFLSLFLSIALSLPLSLSLSLSFSYTCTHTHAHTHEHLGIIEEEVCGIKSMHIHVCTTRWPLSTVCSSLAYYVALAVALSVAVGNALFNTSAYRHMAFMHFVLQWVAGPDASWWWVFDP